MSSTAETSLVEMSIVRGAGEGRVGRTYLVFDREFLLSTSGEEREGFIRELRAFQRQDILHSTTGRSAVGRFSLSDGTAVIFRVYSRGGMFRHLVKQTFVRGPRRSSQSGFRPFDEMRVLRRLADAGLAVPRPVAALVRTFPGGIVYRGTVATREIPDVKNALDLTRDAGARPHLLAICFAAGGEARKALQLGVIHRDLHLGNILCDAESKVYLIDFDGAIELPRSADTPFFRNRLSQRFRRSAEKHGCAECADSFDAGLNERDA